MKWGPSGCVSKYLQCQMQHKISPTMYKIKRFDSSHGQQPLSVTRSFIHSFIYLTLLTQNRARVMKEFIIDLNKINKLYNNIK